MGIWCWKSRRKDRLCTVRPKPPTFVGPRYAFSTTIKKLTTVLPSDYHILDRSRSIDSSCQSSSMPSILELQTTSIKIASANVSPSNFSPFVNDLPLLRLPSIDVIVSIRKPDSRYLGQWQSSGYYILCEVDQQGAHFVGYFSKALNSIIYGFVCGLLMISVAPLLSMSLYCWTSRDLEALIDNSQSIDWPIAISCMITAFFFGWPVVSATITRLYRSIEQNPNGNMEKEKSTPEYNNLSCIMTLPPFQRKKYGKFLIDLCYEIAKREINEGSPEKPLSDLGNLTYRSYWAWALLKAMRNSMNGTMLDKDLSQISSIAEVDIMDTLQALGILKFWKGHHVICSTPHLIDECLKNEMFKKPKMTVDAGCVCWGPPRPHQVKIEKPENTRTSGHFRIPRLDLFIPA